MDRKLIERTTATIAVVLLFFITTTGILYIADQFFNWDIFPPDVEKILGFVMVSAICMIASSVLVNIMINLSIIAINSEHTSRGHHE